MSYFSFLGLFLVIPITLLLWLTRRDWQRGRQRPAQLASSPAWLALLLHVVIAFVYTTPWDNYLVATRVWWYDPNLVAGVTLGWVPIEEYTFFVLQPILTGLWLLFWMRHWPDEPAGEWQNGRLRVASVAVVAATWLTALAILVVGWRPGTYLALQLAWALPPIVLQLAVGADILWRYRRLVLTGILPPTLYLAAIDTLAISSGTWTIDPEQSLHLLLGGVLPVEEFLFFLVTNMLLVFGMTLILARETKSRIAAHRIPAWGIGD
jgi:lycopene cyclase domain-containing protein